MNLEDKAIASCLVFKGAEFDPFEIWVIDCFPKPQKFNGASGSHPVFHNVFRLNGVLMPRDVGERNEVILPFLENDDFSSLHVDCLIAHNRVYTKYCL